MFNQQQQSRYQQNMAIVRRGVRLGALPAMLVYRRNLGYEIVHPGAVVGVCFVMGFIAEWLSQETPFAEALLIFALVTLWEGAAQRIKRSREIRRGGHCLHTNYIGDSQLQRLWWPKFMRHSRRIERLVDPLVCLLIGFPIAHYFSPALGGWLVFSGLCLRILEWEAHKKELRRALDTLNGLVEAEMQAQVVNHFSVRVEPLQHATITESGIATGSGADIQQSIRRRKAKRNHQRHDDQFPDQ